MTVSKNDYNYNGTNNSVNFYHAIPSGTGIVIERVTTLERANTYSTFGGGFRPESLNYDFDSIYKVLQEKGVEKAEALASLIDVLVGLSEADRNVLQALYDQTEANIHTDTGVLALIQEELSKRGTEDQALDLLDKLRDGYVLEDLKLYVDNILAIQNPNLLTGITSRLIYDHETGETVKQNFDRLLDKSSQLVKDSAIILNSGRTLYDLTNESINLKDFKKYSDGEDWSEAIIQAIAKAKSEGKSLEVPSGTYGYSKSFTTEVHIFGKGLHNTRFKKLAPATITMLNGSIRDITISADAIISGDVTHGLVAEGVDRKYIENVLIEKHGGDGFVYKRGNLSRFFLRSRLNGGRGVTFANDVLTGDNKACELWIEVTANIKSGFYMEDSTTVSQNSGQHRGFIIAQSNGSGAVVGDNYNAVLSGNYNDLQLYTEYVGGVWHKASLKGSKIFYSNISHPLFKDEASDSNIVSYIPSSNGSRSTKNEIFEKLTIFKENASYSGKLTLSHTANNTFSFEATLSGAQQYIDIPDNISLRHSKGTYTKNVLSGATLTFGIIPASSSVEKAVTLTSNINLTSAQTAVIANPAGDLGQHLVWSVYISPTDLTKAVIRVANPTTIDISSNTLAWRVQVIL